MTILIININSSRSMKPVLQIQMQEAESKIEINIQEEYDDQIYFLPIHN